MLGLIHEEEDRFYLYHCMFYLLCFDHRKVSCCLSEAMQYRLHILVDFVYCFCPEEQKQISEIQDDSRNFCIIHFDHILSEEELCLTDFFQLFLFSSGYCGKDHKIERNVRSLEKTVSG